MQVLVLLAPHSGIGRTTLARGLALQAQRAGDRLVVLLDADASGDLSRWAAREDDPALIVVPWDSSCAGPEFQALAETGVPRVVIDGPDPQSETRLDETLSAAHLAAILVRPSEDDLAGLGALIDRVEAAGKPFVFIVNQARTSGRMTPATAVALAQYGTVCPVMMRYGWHEAREGDRNGAEPRATEVEDSDIARLWDYLRARLDRYAPAERLAERAAPSARERRRFMRHVFDVHATFTWREQVFPCRVHDISAGGVALTCPMPLPAGIRVRLHIPYLGEFDAEPARASNEVTGLRFVIDEWRQAGLAQDLAALVRHETSAQPTDEGPAAKGASRAAGRRTA